ncbi:MAG TPA: S-adenosylmethionine:tRNA ribosyltransferase-isomerase, partial [Cyclobacteriaceae bacterium]|nr:S-adenosylmethionine:tRNA ribosyltransferase-isomerase [Cyclobacteriaceae bacterium]
MWVIDPEQYTYHLPQERIAMFPADQRDNSRLLYYHKGRITHHIFRDIPSLLPEKSLLVLNDTRVIPARLHFRKSNGVLIEIFLLRPVSPTGILVKAMTARSETAWKCMIGNLKRWHDHQTLVMQTNSGGKVLELNANLEDPGNNLVKFSWNDPSLTFADIIHIFGKVP